MTLRQSMDEACRRLGLSESQIKESQLFSRMHVPGPWGDVKIKDGMEEFMISENIKLIKRISDSPEAMESAMRTLSAAMQPIVRSN